MSLKSKKAFTLTELIVVIAIIAILSAVMIPSLSGYIGKAKLSSDKLTIKSINNTISMNMTLGEEYESIDEVIDSLEEKVKDFMPSSKDYSFCYDNYTKRFFLIDSNLDPVDNQESIGIDKKEWMIFTDNVETITTNQSNNIKIGYYLLTNTNEDLVFDYPITFGVKSPYTFNGKITVNTENVGEINICGEYNTVEVNALNCDLIQSGTIGTLNILAIASSTAYIKGSITELNFGNEENSANGRIVFKKTASITNLNNYGTPNSMIQNNGLIVNHLDHSAGTFINYSSSQITSSGITEATYSFETDYIGKIPTGINVCFYNNTFSRGFSWFTDDTVTATEMYIVESELGEKANFESSLPVSLLTNIVTLDNNNVGKSTDNQSNLIHRAYIENLSNSKTYSYKIGATIDSNSYYAYGTFTTEDDNKITILSLTDSQTKQPEKLFFFENTMASAISEVGFNDIDFISFGGDMYDQNLYSNSATKTASITNRYNRWQVMHDTMTEYSESIPFVATSGNHDSLTNGIFVNTSNIDYSGTNNQGGYYSFDYLNLHFIVLNSNGVSTDISNDDNGQLSWLEEDLENANSNSNIDWIIVSLHNGLYSSGDHSHDLNTYNLIIKYGPIFSKHHVDLVLQGHDHTYAKSNPYKWNGSGYILKNATIEEKEEVIEYTPETRVVGNVSYDYNSNSTYYITINAAGHRVGEEEGTTYTTDGYYQNKCNYEISLDTIVGGCSFDGYSITNGQTSAQNIPYGVFGELTIVNNRLVYNSYIVLEDGSSHLFDTLAILKD